MTVKGMGPDLMARLVDRNLRVDAELPGDVRDFQQGSILVSPPPRV